MVRAFSTPFAKMRLSIRKAVENLFHIAAVLEKGISPLFGKGQEGTRNLVDELLFYLYVSGGFEFAEMGGEISPGEVCLVHQEQKVGAFDYGQIG